MMKSAVRRAVLAVVTMAVSVVKALDVADGGALTITDGLATSTEAIVCKGSATLTLSLTKSGGIYVVDRPIHAQSGTVTVDLAACADAPVLFARDFRANGSGHVVFTGGTHVLLGEKNPVDLDESVTAVPRYGFAALEGPEGFQLVFTNAALLAVSMPANVNWSVAEGANILVKPENGLASLLGSGNAIVLTDFDVGMLSTNTFPLTATVTVPAGRTVTLKPLSFDATTWSIASLDKQNYLQKFNLSDPSSTLLCRGTSNTSLCGSISGFGMLRLYEGFSGTSYLSAACTFTGPVVLDAKDTTGKGFNLELSVKNALGGGNEVRLSGANKLQIRNVQTIGSISALTPNAPIEFYSNGSLTLNGLSGSVKVAKILATVSNVSVSLTGASDGAVLWHDSGFPVTISDAIPVGRADIVRTGAAASQTYHVFGQAPSGVLPAWSDDDAIDVKAAPGAAFDLPLGKNEIALAVASGATVSVERVECDIESDASLWLDASVAASVVAVTNGSGVVQNYAAGQPYVQEWYDCRASHRVPYLLNYRCYGQSSLSADKGAWANVLTTQPIRGATTQNGLPVMDMSDNARRLISAKASGYGSLSAKFCVMVFNSEKGGGKALLATTKGSLSRGTGASRSDYSASSPITTNKSVSVWLNGAQVDPTKTGLSGSWDIVSIDTTGLNVNGLGISGLNATDGAGGSRYAEVIFFDRVLDMAERVSVERYLAKKWALTDKYAVNCGKVVLSGFGTVGVPSGCAVEGNFGGRLLLAEGARLACGSLVPPTEADVAAISGRVRWMDPDDSAAVVFSRQATRPREVIELRDRSAHESYPSLIGSSVNDAQSADKVRAPWLNDRVRGFGPKRGWLDYANVYKNAAGADDTGGNYLKFSTDGTENKVAPIKVRTAFVVTDMARGGTPLLDTAAGSSIPKRSSTADPIWPSGTTDELTGGTTYLNGVSVDGTRVSFGVDGPELFAFTTKANAVDVGYLGCYSTTQGKFGESFGEVLGESIFYNRVLADAERQKIEAYLMWKWLGCLPASYENYYGAATIVGAGELVSDSLAGVPDLSADFTGTVTVSGSTLNFTFDHATGTVPDAFAAPQASLALADAVTVSVAVVGGRLKTGSYALIDAKAIGGSTAFSLALTGISSGEAERASLAVEGGKLVMNVQPSGLMILFR